MMREATLITARTSSVVRSLSLAAFAALAACSGLRSANHPAPQSPPPPVVEEPPPAPPENTVAESSTDAHPSESTAPPTCTCAETKAKPKPKPKPRPVHKEAPPQLPTAPVVAETKPGAVVAAQVRPMSVSVTSILGKRVQGPSGEDLGRVVDVLADASGRVRIAIIDFGGFLGVGNHRIAVDWPLLKFTPEAGDSPLLLSLDREQLKAAPEYKDTPRPQTLMEPPTPTSAPASPSAAPASPTPGPVSPTPAPAAGSTAAPSPGASTPAESRK